MACVEGNLAFGIQVLIVTLLNILDMPTDIAKSKEADIGLPQLDCTPVPLLLNLVKRDIV